MKTRAFPLSLALALLLPAADADCMETLESNYGDELSDRDTEIREAMEAAETGFPLEPGG